MDLKRLLTRSSRFIFIVLASLWIMFEEWVWDTLMALMEKIGHLKIVNRFEAFLTKQNPYILLSLFLFPFLIMVPAKIYGIYLVTEGKTLRGILIFVLAKGFITAFVTRLFFVSKYKLMQIKNFAASYYWVAEKKDWLYAELNKLPAWQVARKSVAALKRLIKNKTLTLKRGGWILSKINNAKLKIKK
jgi:hypothetical protein